MSYATTPKPSPPPPPPTPPPPSAASFNVGGLYLELAEGALTVRSLNKSIAAGGKFDKSNNFSFVGSSTNQPSFGCHLLGDVTIRLAPSAGFPTKLGSGGTAWAMFDSAFGTTESWSRITNVSSTDSKVRAAHDITAVLDASQQHAGYNSSLFQEGSPPIQVVRSWEKAAGSGGGVVLRFKITNTWTGDLKIGGLGLPMPQAGMQKGIEESVWLDPHIGGDHGFVEWVRVVRDSSGRFPTELRDSSPHRIM
jgi:hypothetical protein